MDIKISAAKAITPPTIEPSRLGELEKDDVLDGVALMLKETLDELVLTLWPLVITNELVIVCVVVVADVRSTGVAVLLGVARSGGPAPKEVGGNPTSGKGPTGID